MNVIRNLQAPVKLPKKAVLTIGNFDGVHRGHCAVVAKLKKYAAIDQNPTVAITFENHPSNILRPDDPIPFICTLKHRLKLLEEAGLNLIILLPFTRELSQQTAEDFLAFIQTRLPFAYLVLGHDATLGKNRQGNRCQIKELAQNLAFEVEYLNQYVYEDIPVSSSKIRELIRGGAFEQVEKLLGRRYSIYSTIETGLGNGRKIGFPTANIKLGGICLPPLGVYAVRVKMQGLWLPGVANLGHAPTVRGDSKPILEVHLFGHHGDLYNQDVEVFFYGYIRPEIKFKNIEELKLQIAKDVDKAGHVLS